MVTNAVPESTKMSTKHAANVFEGVESYDIVLRKLSQFVKFWSNHSENKVPVSQLNVLIYVNRAHPPSDQHWLFLRAVYARYKN